MSIVIQINPSLETRLREKAVTKGMGLNQFISQFLEHTFPDKSPLQPVVSEREATLLQQIDLDISIEKWEQYVSLKDKRQNKTLSEIDRNELIELTNDIELANAKRISVLAELAQIRNQPIRIVMEELGLTPADDE